jgi:hypothetical protein
MIELLTMLSVPISFIAIVYWAQRSVHIEMRPGYEIFTHWRYHSPEAVEKRRQE